MLGRLWFIDFKNEWNWVWIKFLFEVREVVAKSCVSFLCFVREFICG